MEVLLQSQTTERKPFYSKQKKMARIMMTK